MDNGNPDHLIGALGTVMAMPGLRLSAAGTCQLLFDQRWLVTLVHDAATGMLWFHCPVGPAAPADTRLSASTLSDMLRGNFMGQGCGGGALSIGPDGRPYLHLHIPLADAKVQDLHEGLEALLDHCEVWARRIQDTESADVAARGQESLATAGIVTSSPPTWTMQRV